MLGRDDAIKTIQMAYAARVRGDKEALSQYWAEGAHFEIVGDPTLLEGVPLSAPEPMEAVSALIDRFEFSDLKLLNSVVDGADIAVRWAVTITVAGKPPVNTQLFDLIKLNEAGKIVSLVQFVDTALVRHLAG